MTVRRCIASAAILLLISYSGPAVADASPSAIDDLCDIAVRCGDGIRITVEASDGSVLFHDRLSGTHPDTHYVNAGVGFYTKACEPTDGGGMVAIPAVISTADDLLLNLVQAAEKIVLQVDYVGRSLDNRRVDRMPCLVELPRVSDRAFRMDIVLSPSIATSIDLLGSNLRLVVERGTGADGDASR